MFCQETKVTKDIACIIQKLWGSRNCGWEWVPSEEVQGGLISVWNNNLLKSKDVIKSQRVLATKSWSSKDNNIWAVANIFGSNVNDLRDGFSLSLSSMISQWQYHGVLEGTLMLFRSLMRREVGASHIAWKNFQSLSTRMN